MTSCAAPSATRDIPLPEVAAQALAAHLATGPQPDPAGFIFRSRFGRALRQDYYANKVFRPAVGRAGVAPDTSTHDLRHHDASVLLHAGESVIAVAERLGHPPPRC